MPSRELYLLGQRRFLPLFISMFCGALNDNLFKNALIVLTTFHPAFRTSLPTPQLVAIASGLFILPFFLFSATAGLLADKYEKSHIIRWLKWSELVFMLAGAGCFYLESTWGLIGVLFCLGAQSAFFGPIKYSILPDHLSHKELIGGNALMEAGTFLAILLGTIIGGLVVMMDAGITQVAALTIFTACSGLLASRFIPATEARAPETIIHPNILKSTLYVMGYARENRSVFLAIIGIAWFWFVGATFVGQFPPFVKTHIGGNEEVVTTFLSAFSIGVGIGALLCGKMLKGAISARHVPIVMIIMASCIGAVVALSGGEPLELSNEQLIGAREFFHSANHIAMFVALVVLAAAGGFLAVPLFAIMQSRSASSHRARVIAASNIMDALFMVTASILAIVMTASGAHLTDLFAAVALLCLPIAWLMRGIEL